MKKNGFSHIRKWLLLYLSMVLLTTLVLYLSIYVDIHRTFSAINFENAAALKTGAEPNLQELIAGLKVRLLFILTGGLLACVILGYVWLEMSARRVIQPVKTIATAMSKLAKGQLNETVTVETSDELEQIGTCINELAANLQELLLYIWKQTGQCHSLLEHINRNPVLYHDNRLTLEEMGHLKQLADAIDDLRGMARAYVFYDVSIDGSETQAIKEPGNGSASSNFPADYN